MPAWVWFTGVATLSFLDGYLRSGSNPKRRRVAAVQSASGGQEIAAAIEKLGKNYENKKQLFHAEARRTRSQSFKTGFYSVSFSVFRG